MPPDAPKSDLFVAVVDQTIDAKDEEDACAEDAKKVDTLAIIKSEMGRPGAGTAIVESLLNEAARVSFGRIVRQKALAAKHVKEQNAATTKADPTTVPAVTDVDVAARRAEKLLEVKQ